MPLEIIAGAVVGAAAANASVRKVVRSGMIYGLAGVLIAYDKVAAVTTTLVAGARKTVAKETAADAEATSPTNAEAAEPSSPESVSRSTAVASTS